MTDAGGVSSGSADGSATPERAGRQELGRGEETSAGMALELASPAFDDGDPIPEEYGYERRNVNPPLRISDVPDEAASLALLVDDPDAKEPAGKVWGHWVAWNVAPETTEIAADATPTGATEGENDFGERGYGGPNPPDGEHTYHFRLFALDEPLDLDAGATKEELEEALSGRVIEETELRGTYAPQ